MARGGRHQTHELVAPDDVAKASRPHGRHSMSRSRVRRRTRRTTGISRSAKRGAAHCARLACGEALALIIANVEALAEKKRLWRSLLEALLPFSSDARKRAHPRHSTCFIAVSILQPAQVA